MELARPSTSGEGFGDYARLLLDLKRREMAPLVLVVVRPLNVLLMARYVCVNALTVR